MKGDEKHGWRILTKRLPWLSAVAPVGIDKGWAYAPGASRVEQLQKFAAEKAGKMPGPLGDALTQDAANVGAGETVVAAAFVEQKTAKAAAEWAMKNNLADFADYTGVMPEVANAFNQSLFDHLKEFPALRADMKFAGSCQAQFARWRQIEMDRYIDALRKANPQLPADYDFTKHAENYIKPKKVDGKSWAHAWEQRDVSGIGVNNKWGGDTDGFAASVINSEKSGWHPVGCSTIKSVADHEIGHMLDFHLRLAACRT